MRWFKFYSARPRVEFTYGVYTSGSRSEELRQTLKLVSGHGGRVISVTGNLMVQEVRSSLRKDMSLLPNFGLDSASV